MSSTKIDTFFRVDLLCHQILWLLFIRLYKIGKKRKINDELSGGGRRGMQNGEQTAMRRGGGEQGTWKVMHFVEWSGGFAKLIGTETMAKTFKPTEIEEKMQRILWKNPHFFFKIF